MQYIAVDGIARDLYAAEAAPAPTSSPFGPAQAQTETAGLHDQTVMISVLNQITSCAKLI